MTTTIRVRRGTQVNLPDLQVGEPGFATDTETLYIGSGAGTAEDAAFCTMYEVDALQHEPNTYTQATIEAALTAIGTSNLTTLILRPGTWVISSNADWSAYTNVTFDIVSGAIFSTGAFTMAFPDGTTAYPEWFSDADYGARINQAINSVTTNGGIVEVTKAGSFATTIELTGAIVNFNKYLLTYTGSGTAVKNKDTIRPGDFTGLNLTTTKDWANTNLIGLSLTEAYQMMSSIKAIENFYIGFSITTPDASTNILYNQFWLGRLSVNKFGIYALLSNATSSIVSNRFYGGNFSSGTVPAPAGTVGIKLESTTSIPIFHNTFYSPTIEAMAIGIKHVFSAHNEVYSPYFEANTEDITYDADSTKNKFYSPYPIDPVVTDSSISTDDINYEAISNLNAGTRYKDITIASDIIDVTGNGFIAVTPQGGSGADDLVTINGGRKGDLIVLYPRSTAWIITVKHGTGNILLSNKHDLNISPDIKLLLFYDGTNWYELGNYGGSKKADETLLSTTSISLAANADTVLYTVPLLQNLILTKAILYVGADANGTTISIGQATMETDFIPNNTLSNLDVDGAVGILQPIPSTTPFKNIRYGAGKVIEARIGSQAGGATNTIRLFGFLY